MPRILAAGPYLLAALLASLGRRGRQLADLVLQSFDALVHRRRLASVHEIPRTAADLASLLFMSASELFALTTR